MKKRLIASFVLLFCFALMVSCQQKDAGIYAKSAWARPGIAGGNSAVYLILQNTLANPDTLLSASSEVADKVEIHMSSMGANGTMMMRPAGPVELAAQSIVEFKPGGLHIMLIGLKNDLSVGATITVVLQFENSDPITIQVPIQEAAN